MLLQNKRAEFNKAFGKLIFSNSKLDIFTRDGKLCSVNRDLLIFFSPYIKQLLKDVPDGVRASLVLPGVSIECLEHVFKVLSEGSTDFTSIQDVKDAGDLLGISLHSLEYVQMIKERDMKSDDRVLKETCAPLTLNTQNIKKEVIDTSEIKTEPETVDKQVKEEPNAKADKNITPEEILLSIQAIQTETLSKTSWDELETSKIDKRDLATKLIPSENPIKVELPSRLLKFQQKIFLQAGLPSSRLVLKEATKLKVRSNQVEKNPILSNFDPSAHAHRRRKTPAQIRRNLRRAHLNKSAINIDQNERTIDSSSNIKEDKSTGIGSEKANKLSSVRQVYGQDRHQKSTLQPRIPEEHSHINYSRSNNGYSGSSRDPRRRSRSTSREFKTRLDERKYRHPAINPFYTLEEGEID